MNKWLIGALVFFGLLSAGLWGYYIYRANKPASSTTRVTVFITPAPGTILDWSNVAQIVLPDCKTESVSTQSAVLNGDASLFSSLNNGKAPAQGQLLLVTTVPKNGNACRVALLGNANSKGSIAYLTEAGQIKKMDVVNTPVTSSQAPLSSPPTPSPSATP
jgi:hypothetical protein